LSRWQELDPDLRRFHLFCLAKYGERMIILLRKSPYSNKSAIDLPKKRFLDQVRDRLQGYHNGSGNWTLFFT
jgi:hypothetical protein